MANKSNYFPRKKLPFQKLKSLSGRGSQPEEEIYQEILSKYNLVPERTLFIDDTLVNVEGAKKLGIDTIHLKEKERLKDELLEKNIEL